MRLAPRGLEPDRVLRKILPRSLFGRTLLIVILPLILLEGVALQIFYGSHLDVLSRRLAGSVAGEIAFVLDQAALHPASSARIFAHAGQRFQFRFHFHEGETLTPRGLPHVFGPVDTDLARALRRDLNRKFSLVWNGPPGMIRVDVQLATGVMTVDVPRKRLYVGALYIFFAWLAGVTILLLGIAILFLRNQVRAIRRLALAAEAFGMGRDPGPIRPEGAIEVRRAATAFNRMQDRIRRFLTQRTAMLAGVSHDLRTPLTRLRLAIAMLPPDIADTDGMNDDVTEMERLIGLYLTFARGEGTEQPQPTDIALLIEDLAARAARGGAAIALDLAHLPQAGGPAGGDAPGAVQPARQRGPPRPPHRRRGGAGRRADAADRHRRRWPRHPRRASRADAASLRKRLGRRHRPRPRHRPRHRRGAWRHAPPRYQPARRPAGGDHDPALTRRRPARHGNDMAGSYAKI
ncbi:Integral membrane sensor signal transduction histidine kinase [Acidiphilium sp. PM]|nr:Integral membrane sensor signal transduction histidine kinase [Acidiphilium sp. PM]